MDFAPRFLSVLLQASLLGALLRLGAAAILAIHAVAFGIFTCATRLHLIISWPFNLPCNITNTFSAPLALMVLFALRKLFVEMLAAYRRPSQPTASSTRS